MVLSKLLKRTKTFIYSVFFNFKVLPWKQAVHLPFCCYVWPTIRNSSGIIRFEGKPIRRYMVKLGVQRTPISTPSSFIWTNLGTIVFKGCVSIGHHALISVHKDGYLEFGDQVLLNSGCRIVSQKKIVFEYKARSSWDCQFYDTNFHPVIDMINGKTMKMCSPIIIGRNVWIGHNVIISKGVKLAEGIIVSSGSVVKNPFKEENCIISGNPALKIDSGYKAVLPDIR